MMALGARIRAYRAVGGALAAADRTIKIFLDAWAVRRWLDSHLR